jgi:Trk K+ transport system NAD-binding subunit
MTDSTTPQPSESVSVPPGSVDFTIRRVGVVGLGHMGHAFAVNLLEDNYQVSVYDRDAKRAAEVGGATAAAHLGDLAACEVVLTSLPDDDALAAVALGANGLAAILRPNAVHISTSTVSPAMSRRVAEEHARLARIMSPRQYSGTRTSRGRESCSCLPPARRRRCRRFVRCSSAWGSGCS